jgi:hypothetical protein
MTSNAGSVVLNIQAANAVVNVDLPFRYSSIRFGISIKTNCNITKNEILTIIAIIRGSQL